MKKIYNRKLVVDTKTLVLHKPEFLQEKKDMVTVGSMIVFDTVNKTRKKEELGKVIAINDNYLEISFNNAWKIVTWDSLIGIYLSQEKSAERTRSSQEYIFFNRYLDEVEKLCDFLSIKRKIDLKFQRNYSKVLLSALITLNKDFIKLEMMHKKHDVLYLLITNSLSVSKSRIAMDKNDDIDVYIVRKHINKLISNNKKKVSKKC